MTTSKTSWLVLMIAACLLSVMAIPHGERHDPSLEDFRLNLTSGSTTILVSWNITLPTVTVAWKDQYDNRGEVVVVHASRALITGLKPSTAVTVTVYANGKYKPFIATRSTFTASRDLPLILSAGAETILAQWKQTLSRVTLSWRDECGSEGYQILDDATEAVINNLSPYSFVTVSLDPSDAENSSAATEIIQTLSKAPPQVSNLQLSYASDKDMSVAWERPDTKCPPITVHITYSGVAKYGSSIHTDPQTTVLGDVTTATISDLQPYTEYDVEVVAASGDLMAKPAIITATTAEGVPSRPSELKSVSQTSNSISLTWKEPKEPNGKITNYIVSWYQDEMKVDSTTVDYPTYTIVGLSPCVEYKVRVAANTGAGEGEFDEITQVTATDLPHILNTFCSIAPDTQEITVTWSVEEFACLVTDYELSWQNVTDQIITVIDAFSIGASPGHTTKMPAEQHGPVCVTAKIEQKRGPRTCCTEMVPTKLSENGNWKTLMVIGIISVVMMALLGFVFVLYRIFFLHRPQQSKQLLALEPSLSVDTELLNLFGRKKKTLSC